MNRVLRVCTDDRVNDDFAIISSNVSKKIIEVHLCETSDMDPFPAACLHIICCLGYGLLTVLGVSSSLVVRSYVLDDYIPGYPDKLFPVEYITYWLSQNNQVRNVIKLNIIFA